MLTVQNIEDFCRSETGELDGKKVSSTWILRRINYEQNNIQNKLASINFKTFKKTSYQTGSVFTEPSDMLKVPNAIINLLASGGTVRAFKTISYTTPTGNLTHTYKEPGTGGNSISISCDGATYATPSAGTISCLLVGGVFHLDFAYGVMTASAIAALFNADPIYSQYFICSTTLPSAVIAPSVGTAGTLATGAGANYYPADEVSDENFARMESNSYEAPTSTYYKFRRMGNANGKIIEILPNTATYCQLEYYYRLADLTATTDTLAVPAEVEELVILGVIRSIYNKVGKTGEADKTAKQWQTQYQEYLESYGQKRQSEVAEKVRLQSADAEN